MVTNVLIFIFFEDEGNGGAYIIFVVFTDAYLSEVFHEILDIDPEDAVICLLEMQLLSQFFAPNIGVI